MAGVDARARTGLAGARLLPGRHSRPYLGRIGTAEPGHPGLCGRGAHPGRGRPPARRDHAGCGPRGGGGRRHPPIRRLRDRAYRLERRRHRLTGRGDLRGRPEGRAGRATTGDGAGSGQGSGHACGTDGQHDHRIHPGRLRADVRCGTDRRHSSAEHRGQAQVGHHQRGEPQVCRGDAPPQYGVRGFLRRRRERTGDRRVRCGDVSRRVERARAVFPGRACAQPLRSADRRDHRRRLAFGGVRCLRRGRDRRRTDPTAGYG